jgi:hypothetical protein
MANRPVVVVEIEIDNATSEAIGRSNAAIE